MILYLRAGRDSRVLSHAFAVFLVIHLHKLERKYLIEVIEATRLLHGVCVDESSACYVGCSRQRIRGGFAHATSWFTSLQIHAESQNEKRERHDSIVTLTAH